MGEVRALGINLFGSDRKMEVEEVMGGGIMKR
jgi:hypothetical protein